MKNGLLILNIVLLAAVGFLFYKVFSTPKAEPAKLPIANKKNDSTGAIRVGYVELDSLDNYPLAKEVRASLRQLEAQSQKELLKIRDEYVAMGKEYQQKAQQGMSQEMEGQYKERLEQKDREYSQEAQNKEQLMRNEMANRNHELRGKIKSVIKVYAEQNGFDFIYSTEEMDNIFYKNKAMDVTAEVLAALNADYDKNKKVK